MIKIKIINQSQKDWLNRDWTRIYPLCLRLPLLLELFALLDEALEWVDVGLVVVAAAAVVRGAVDVEAAVEEDLVGGAVVDGCVGEAQVRLEVGCVVETPHFGHYKGISWKELLLEIRVII